MLLTSVFDCAFGFGAFNFVYLLCLLFGESFAILFLAPGWITTLYLLGYEHFLERFYGNIEIAKFFIDIDGECPFILLEKGQSDILYDIKLSVAFVIMNIICSLIYNKNNGTPFEYTWRLGWTPSEGISFFY